MHDPSNLRVLMRAHQARSARCSGLRLTDVKLRAVQQNNPYFKVFLDVAKVCWLFSGKLPSICDGLLCCFQEYGAEVNKATAAAASGDNFGMRIFVCAPMFISMNSFVLESFMFI